MQNNKFEYKYSVPTKRERREIESIRRQYAMVDDGTEENKLMRLRELHKGIVNTAKAVSIALGVVGLLIFGGGMALAIETAEPLGMVIGIALSAVGAVPTALAYPVYKLVFNSKKKKRADEILRLSDELLGNEKK